MAAPSRRRRAAADQDDVSGQGEQRGRALPGEEMRQHADAGGGHRDAGEHAAADLRDQRFGNQLIQREGEGRAEHQRDAERDMGALAAPPSRKIVAMPA